MYCLFDIDCKKPCWKHLEYFTSSARGDKFFEHNSLPDEFDSWMHLVATLSFPPLARRAMTFLELGFGPELLPPEATQTAGHPSASSTPLHFF